MTKFRPRNVLHRSTESHSGHMCLGIACNVTTSFKCLIKLTALTYTDFRFHTTALLLKIKLDGSIKKSVHDLQAQKKQIISAIFI